MGGGGEQLRRGGPENGICRVERGSTCLEEGKEEYQTASGKTSQGLLDHEKGGDHEGKKVQKVAKKKKKNTPARHDGRQVKEDGFGGVRERTRGPLGENTKKKKNWWVRSKKNREEKKRGEGGRSPRRGKVPQYQTWGAET